MSNDYFPRLELVPTGSILFHEHAEAARTERLLGRIRNDALLRNPPVVADIGEGRYLLLDGANRVSAFLALEYELTPVQIVDYSDHEIELKGWHHMIMDAPDLVETTHFSGLVGVALTAVDSDDLPRHLGFRSVYAVWIDTQGQAFGLFPPEGHRPSLEERMTVLNEFIALYEGQGRIELIIVCNLYAL
ncbi:MAG: hypothetical protein AAF493_23715, partial [Pseudomonadota bacterium]